MLEIQIPGYRDLALEHLVLDYNGTLACDGRLVEGVRQRLESLADRLRIHVLTADTFGNAAARLEGVSCCISVLLRDGQDERKRDYVKALGADVTVAIGNGRNDRLMLNDAALGIAVVQGEGAAVGTVQAADVACGSILDALDLLLHPLRLVATLRS